MPPVTGHVFISYSHVEAADYVARLGEHLDAAGIPVWYDREIISGDRWRHVIRQQLDACGAVVVVMTPGAEASAWVDRELVRAENQGKPVLPLLLAGTVFFGLGDLQYEDVRTGAMPGAAFTDRLYDLLGYEDQDEDEDEDKDDEDEDEGDDEPEEGGPAPADPKADAWRRLYLNMVLQNSRMFGIDHPNTLTSRHLMAEQIGNSGDTVEAIRLLRDIVIARARVLGEDHPDTRKSMRLAEFYLGQLGG